MLLTIDVPSSFVQDVFHMVPTGPQQDAATCRFPITEEDPRLWKLAEKFMEALGLPSLRDAHVELLPEADSMIVYTEDIVRRGVIEPSLWVLLRAGALQALRVAKVPAFHLEN